MRLPFPRTHAAATSPQLAALLAAAAAPADAGPLPGEAAALAAFRQQRGISLAGARSRRRIPQQLVAIAMASGVFATGGVAAAATGHLPAAAQRVAHDVFSAIGVDVPSPHARTHHTPAGTSHPVTPVVLPSATPAAHPTHPAHPAHPATPGKGATISQLAHQTTGRKGPTVSKAASGGHSNAGTTHSHATSTVHQGGGSTSTHPTSGGSSTPHSTGGGSPAAGGSQHHSHVVVHPHAH